MKLSPELGQLLDSLTDAPLDERAGMRAILKMGEQNIKDSKAQTGLKSKTDHQKLAVLNKFESKESNTADSVDE